MKILENVECDVYYIADNDFHKIHGNIIGHDCGCIYVKKKWARDVTTIFRNSLFSVVYFMGVEKRKKRRKSGKTKDLDMIGL